MKVVVMWAVKLPRGFMLKPRKVHMLSNVDANGRP